VCEGALLGAYAFDRYRTTSGADHRPPVESLVLLAEQDGEALQAAVRRAEVVVRAVHLARDLVNTPPSDLHPEDLAEVAREPAEAVGVEVEVLDEEALVDGGFGGIVGVGQGSVNAPRWCTCPTAAAAAPARRCASSARASPSTRAACRSSRRRRWRR
jgi:leucyl aminopeptidase